jgi:RHH-type proline utilization regulon transcriptional repressor/proline dehydrogenase/delta 1-pyrroline-5-carboxylate dehydrogenase
MEARTLELGQEILRRAKAQEQKRSSADRWLHSFLAKSMADDDFRVRALRFIDALPALTDDRDLVEHLNAYFGRGELPLPGLLQWGFDRATSALSPKLLAPAVRKTMKTMSQRFLGGSDLRSVESTVVRLQRHGAKVSLDRLGEAVVSDREAQLYQGAYLDTVRELGKRVEDLNLSLKVSSFYPRAKACDPEGAVEGMAGRLRPLLDAAREQRLSVCFDMEQYDLKGITLALFQQVMMLPQFRAWEGLGIALQTYLRDTEQDLRRLARWSEERGTRVTVRLVRGAYWDQEQVLAGRQGWPSPVWPTKGETDRCFEHCLSLLMAAHDRLRPAVATHNVRSIALTMALAEEAGLQRTEFEFQMLYGMGESLRKAILEMGYPVRVYTPFGELLPSMAYLVRRLLENSSSQSFLQMGSLPETDSEQLLRPTYTRQTATGETASAADSIFMNEPVRRFTAEGEREHFRSALEQVRGELGQYYPLVIGGKEREGDAILRSVNPARPDELVGRVGSAGQKQAQEAVEAATAAFPEWAGRDAEERAEWLHRLAGKLRDRREEFAAWEVFEAGKAWPEADADVTEAIDFLEYYAAEARRLAAGGNMDLAGETNRYRYIPRGVGLVLPPWNFPLAILVGMLSATIVAGNTAILKPSSQTPVVAVRFMQLIQEVGLPDGVVNFLPGPGDSVGEFLVQHPGIHVIAFTGSVEVGTRINRLAAHMGPGQNHVKRVVAEMGGKNAIIVDSGADLDEAVLGVTASAFGFQGQKCSACSRVILVGAAYEPFLRRLVDAIESLRIGYPEEPGTEVGPVIEAAARRRILGVIADAARERPPLLSREVSSLAPGYFVGPTLFDEVHPESPLAQEEIFGPVLAALRATDLDQALAMANNTRFALTGGVFSRNPLHLERAAREFHVGNLYLNRGITGALVGRQPFGGFRLSGVGSKAGGPDYLLQFMEPRTVTENTLRRGYAPAEPEGPG